MVLRISVEACIGCGVCMEVCPSVFKLDEEEGKSTVVKPSFGDEDAACVKTAIECCPVGCINE